MEKIDPSESIMQDTNAVILDQIPDITWVKSILKQEKHREYAFLSNQLDLDWEKFKDNFKQVSAAGGIVQNGSKELLCIFRNGKWDLPKGKVEKGEEIQVAAVREVEEETGVKVNQIDELNSLTTYHVYELKNKVILKPTHWFAMESLDQHVELVPQLEEGIAQVKWMNREELNRIFLPNTFPSIEQLILTFL